MKTALMFPGQGSQKPGMGLDYYDVSEESKKIFELAREELGWDVADNLKSADEKELSRTEICQPLIYIVSCAVFEHIKNSERDISFVCGHSLGQFSALYASGSVTFTDGLKLVTKRAQLMGESSGSGDLGMWAVIGLPKEAVTSIINGNEKIFPANFNSSEQTVISGSIEGFEEVSGALQSEGARRIIKLPVSGAFHSPFMSGANEKFKNYIDDVDFKDASTPLVSSGGSSVLQKADAVKEEYKNQMIKSVDWVETIRLLVENKVERLVEVGPGNVLSNLTKRITREIHVFDTDKMQQANVMEGKIG